MRVDLPEIPRSVPATAVGAAGVAGSGITLLAIFQGIADKLSGSDWISVVALAITALVILFGLAGIAVAGALLIYRGSAPPTHTAPRPVSGSEAPTLLLMTGLALVVSGLVIIAIVVLAT